MGTIKLVFCWMLRCIASAQVFGLMLFFNLTVLFSESENGKK
jgi:hypothetical protein